jgi:hypothetical protein
MRILCIYDPTTVDGLLTAALIRRWYEKTHAEHFNHTCVVDLDMNPEQDNGKDLLAFLKFSEDSRSLNGYDRIILTKVTPSDRFMHHVLNTRAYVTWHTNMLDASPWRVNGELNSSCTTAEIIRKNYMGEELKMNMPSSMLNMAYDYLINNSNEYTGNN